MNENKRYQSNKIKDRKAVFLKVALKRKQFYREFLILNKFDQEFDDWKRDNIRLEKFIKISNKECYLTIWSNPYKYFFLWQLIANQKIITY